MASSLSKDTRRSIKHTFGRFLALFAIVALGAGFYAGLSMSGRDMRLGLDEFADTNQMFDIEVISTQGLSDADLLVLSGLEKIKHIMPGRSANVVASAPDGIQYTIQVNSLDLNLIYDNYSDAEGKSSCNHKLAYLNQLQVVEGRLPEEAGEIVIGENIGYIDIEVGDTLTFDEGTTPLDETFNCTEYKVVGIVKDPAYVSASIGSSSLGDGDIDLFAFIPNINFATNYYTEIYLTIDGAEELNSTTKEYDEYIDEVIETISLVAPERTRERLNEIKSIGQQQIDDAKAQIADAEAQISSGKAQISAGEAQLEASHAQLEAAEIEYANGVANLNSSTAQRDEAIAYGYQINSSVANLAGGIFSVREIATSDPEVVEPMLELFGGLEEYQQLRAGIQALTAAGMGYTSSGALDVEGFRRTTDAQINAGWAQLNSSRAQIDAGWQALESGQAELAASKALIGSSYAQLDGTDDQIADAQAQIDAIEEGEWFILNRHKNVGFQSFISDSESMDSIAAVFPLIFLLVAALVALTTMTRMVEDERVTIGTYKALGYSNGQILSKYLIYAGIASVAGAIVGIIICSKILPWVVFNAYSTMYFIPSCPLPIYFPLALLGGGLTVLITLLATYAAVRTSLRETPANLMLPRAPKAGQRILLERITPVWSHLSFMWKVTCRNLFRYKRRLWMTVIGIMGCTALLLTGFGIKDSINDMLDLQFEELYRYNVSIGLQTNSLPAIDDRSYSDNGSDLSATIATYLPSELQEILSDKTFFPENEYESTPELFLNETIEARTPDKDNGIQSYLIVPQNTEALNSIITLRNRHDRDTELTLDASGVIVTEKLAKELNLKVGDEIELSHVDETGQPYAACDYVTITAIAENYLMPYVYMSPALYASFLDKTPPVYNEIRGFATKDTADRDALTLSAASLSCTTTVTYNDTLVGTFNDMLGSLNMVTYVLIVAAAALAFIVLYNLSNINITERQREIASLKVLGFTDREVNSYIYREIIMLTLIGCIFGLVAGIFLCHWVVGAAEVNITMFCRDMRPISFVYSFILTMLFSLMVNFFMNKKLKAIDMVESLKSVD